MKDNHMSNRWSLLKNSTFLSVWLGYLISRLGDSFFSIALGFIVLKETESGLAASLIFAARILGAIITGPFAGTFADRIDRRKLMISMDLCSAALVIGLMFVLKMSVLNIPLIVIGAFLVSITGTFFSTSYSSSIANIVEEKDVPNATNLLQLTGTITQIVGPAIAGAFIAMGIESTALLVDGLSFLLSAFLISIVTFPSPKISSNGEESNSFFHDLKEGFKWLINQPVVFGVALLGPLLSLFGAAHTILILVITTNIWESSGFEYGLVETAWPIGMTLASSLLLLLSNKLRYRGLIICGSFSLAGISYMIAPIMSNVYTSLPFLIVSGLFAGGAVTVMTILLRTIVPSDYQGRVFGFYGTLGNATWPLGALLGGYFSDFISPILLAILCGAGLVLTGIVGVFNRELRRFN